MVKNLIDFDDLSKKQWEDLYRLAMDIKENPLKYSRRCEGKILATLFYEPSTRTMLSFKAAMLRLGGNVLGFDSPSSSSVNKGENLKDTIKMVSNYSDIIVIRHPKEGAALASSLYSFGSVINAGDGSHLHPTQTLADLVTIKSEKKSLNNLKIGMCGDLKNGRTVHSLTKALSRFKDNEFVFISTDELNMPSYIEKILIDKNIKYKKVNTIDECIKDLDILYMTRIQKERFKNEDEYNEQKGVYILDTKKMEKAPKDLLVMHPLPKVDEIEEAVDSDPRAMYYKQANYGMYVRMALIIALLENGETLPSYTKTHGVCQNPDCILSQEKYLPKLKNTKNGRVCLYCDKEFLD